MAPYACLNIRTERFVPRYKYVHCERNFQQEEYVRDFEFLLFNIIYAAEDPNKKLELLNKLVAECIERHTPLKGRKITRPPAPG